MLAQFFFRKSVNKHPSPEQGGSTRALTHGSGHQLGLHTQNVVIMEFMFVASMFFRPESSQYSDKRGNGLQEITGTITR